MQPPTVALARPSAFYLAGELPTESAVHRSDSICEGINKCGDLRGATYTFRNEGAEHESGDQPKMHKKDGDRFGPRAARHLPEGVGRDGTDGGEDTQHAGPEPDPATDQDEHRAAEFNEDAQKRHGRRRRHPGLRHFRNRASKVGDLAEPRNQVSHNQRKTRDRPGPLPFKDSLYKLGRGLAIHGASPSVTKAKPMNRRSPNGK